MTLVCGGARTVRIGMQINAGIRLQRRAALRAELAELAGHSVLFPTARSTTSSGTRLLRIDDGVEERLSCPVHPIPIDVTDALGHIGKRNKK